MRGMQQISNREKWIKCIGWIAIFHVVFILIWLIINIILSITVPATFDQGVPLMEAGLEYHSTLVGYVAMDHGSKSIVMLVTILVPIGMYFLLPNKSFASVTGLIAGVSGFLIYSVSFMLQAVSVAYAINLYQTHTTEYGRQLAMHVFEWTMLEGGFSTSLYVLSNLLLAGWVILYSKQLFNENKRLRLFGYIVGGSLIIGYLTSWVFLMFGHHALHLVTETIGMLFLLWLGLIGMKLVRGQVN